MPKELLPLFGRPVIHHPLEEIAAAQIPEVVIVACPGTWEVLQSYLTPDAGWDKYLTDMGKSHLLQPLCQRVEPPFNTPRDRLVLSPAIIHVLDR